MLLVWVGLALFLLYVASRAQSGGSFGIAVVLFLALCIKIFVDVVLLLHGVPFFGML